MYFDEENKANNRMQAVPQSNNADSGHIEDSADQNVYVHLWYLVGSSPSWASLTVEITFSRGSK